MNAIENVKKAHGELCEFVGLFEDNLDRINRDLAIEKFMAEHVKRQVELDMSGGFQYPGGINLSKLPTRKDMRGILATWYFPAVEAARGGNKNAQDNAESYLRRIHTN